MRRRGRLAEYLCVAKRAWRKHGRVEVVRLASKHWQRGMSFLSQ